MDDKVFKVWEELKEGHKRRIICTRVGAFKYKEIRELLNFTLLFYLKFSILKVIKLLLLTDQLQLLSKVFHP